MDGVFLLKTHCNKNRLDTVATLRLRASSLFPYLCDVAGDVVLDNGSHCQCREGNSRYCAHPYYSSHDLGKGDYDQALKDPTPKAREVQEAEAFLDVVSDLVLDEQRSEEKQERNYSIDWYQEQPYDPDDNLNGAEDEDLDELSYGKPAGLVDLGYYVLNQEEYAKNDSGESRPTNLKHRLLLLEEGQERVENRDYLSSGMQSQP